MTASGPRGNRPAENQSAHLRPADSRPAEAAPPEFRVLLVEDSPAEVLLVEEACALTGLGCQVQVAQDGQAALDLLQQPGAVWRPQLMVLDLNMPRLGGLEVLRVVRQDPALQTLPVVVFTTSGDPAEVARCYELGANAFITKPMDISAYFAAVGTLLRYWQAATRQTGPG